MLDVVWHSRASSKNGWSIAARILPPTVRGLSRGNLRDLAEILKNDDEFVATESGDRVDFAHAI